MPLDAQINELFNLEGTELDFKVKYEDTKFAGKRYVRNSVTGDYLGIVGDKFKSINHIDYFNGIKKVIQENRLPQHLDDAKVKISTARNNAFVFLDITLPNVKHTITTDKSIRLLLVRGLLPYMVLMVLVLTKYTLVLLITSVRMDKLVESMILSREKIRVVSDVLYYLTKYVRQRVTLINVLDSCKSGQTYHSNVDGKIFMSSIIKSENLAKKMYELACQEISKRGKNVFALYSAFTNYASYADERNGFNIRNTGFDTKAETMWRREQEVSKWISSPQFKELLVA